VKKEIKKILTCILEKVHLIFDRNQPLFDQGHFRFPKDHTRKKKNDKFCFINDRVITRKSTVLFNGAVIVCPIVIDKVLNGRVVSL